MSNLKDFFKSKKSWSKYKDKLLMDYLPIFFQKILVNGYDTIYIDGFAGKGKFDDGEDGSPLIVSKIIDKAKSLTKGNSNIFSYYIESKYATDLKNNMGNSANVIDGLYQEVLPGILNRNKSINIFLYVDPFGIKDIDFEIFNLLKNENFVSKELLLNFNSFGFIREGCRLLKIKQNEIDESYDANYLEITNIDYLNKIAGGNYWQEIINEFNEKRISIYEAEEKFVENYKNNLRAIFKYVLDIPIRTNEKYLPKYRMIFGTNHIDGVLIMANKMYNCDKDMQFENTGHQFTFFDYLSDYTCSDAILDTLSDEFIDIKKFCLKLYYEKGVKYSHEEIQNAMKVLEKNNKIIVRRNPDCTTRGKKATALSIMCRDYYIEVKKNVG